jgi:hypothetical protein
VKTNFLGKIGKKYYILLILLLVGLLVYFYSTLSEQFIPLTKTYKDTNSLFTFNYPANGNIYISSSKIDNRLNVVRVFLGEVGNSKACDLFIDSGYEEPSPSVTEVYNGLSWNKWKMDTFTPPLGDFYDTHSVIWWTQVNNHNYRWQAVSSNESVCKRIIKTFQLTK